MKSISRLMLFCSLCLMSTVLLAKDAIDVEKYVKQSYSLSANEAMDLKNQFGKMNFEIWNKNEISVNIHIKSSANSQQKAQKILDGITIEHGQNSRGVFFETKISGNKNNQKNKGNYKEMGFSVDYTIQLPNNHPLVVESSFGNVNLDRYDGASDITVKFGDLESESLTNVENLVVEFGSAEVDNFEGESLTLKFSSVDINNVGGELNIDIEFCKSSEMTLSSHVKSADLDIQHSDITLTLDDGLSANFDIKTSFGKLSNRTSYDVKDHTKKNKYGPNFDHTYSFQVGSGSAPISIDASFSTVTIK